MDSCSEGSRCVLNAEEDLIAKSRNGDIAAFEELISRYERKIYTVAYRFMGNHDDASDVAQEALIRAYHAIKTFRGDSSFYTWLYHIVANIARDELRKRNRNQTTSLDAPVLNDEGDMFRQLADHVMTPDRVYEEKEFQQYLQSLIDALPVEYRLVLVMREIQGFAYEEIAAHLHCSLGTVKSRLSRARQILRTKITSDRELAEERARRLPERKVSGKG